MRDYEFIKDLGEGSSGIVSLYREKVSGKEVAIKKIRKSSSGLISREREISSLKQMSGSPNIIKLYKIEEKPHKTCLVLEYCEDKNLREYFENRKFYHRAHISFICDIVRSIESCHKSGIIHRDLKLENFLVTKGIVKLGDFGLSRLIDFQSTLSMCGTPINMAPEIFTSSNYTSKVDIWALGCIVYEIITQSHPFPAKNFYELEYMQQQNIDMKCLKKKQVEFIELCLEKNHLQRASINDLLDSRLIKSYLTKLYKIIDEAFDFLVENHEKISNYACAGISIYLTTDNIYFWQTKKYRDFTINFLSSCEQSELNTIFIDKCIKSCLLMSKIINGFNSKYSKILLYVFKRLNNIEDMDLIASSLGVNKN